MFQLFAENMPLIIKCRDATFRRNKKQLSWNNGRLIFSKTMIQGLWSYVVAMKIATVIFKQVQVTLMMLY